MSDRVTLKEIARQAGVSAMTVSRALRNQKAIAPETRERIRQIADRLNYCPDPHISELITRIRRKRKEDAGATLAMIWTDLEIKDWKAHYSQNNFAAGIQQRARELGFRLIDLRVSSETDDSRRIDRIIWNRGIRGIIIGVVRPPHQTLNLRWERYAAVALNYTLENPNIHRVATNHYQTLNTALSELHKLGYRRIGLAMKQSTDKRVNYLWRSSYLGYHSVFPELTPVPFFVPEVFQSAPLIRWIKANKVDCVLTESREAYQFMLKNKLRIPEEIGYASFVLYPEDHMLSGMQQPYSAIGSAAVDMVVGLLHNDETGLNEAPRTLLLPSHWQAGETTRTQTK